MDTLSIANNTASSITSDAKSCMLSKFSNLLPNINMASLTSLFDNANFAGLTTSLSSSIYDNMKEYPKLGEQAVQMAKEGEYLKKVKKESKIASAHNNQDAKKSISFSEPVPAGVGKSTVKDQKKPDYTCEEDYPLSYGSVDESNNWYKVNQATGEVEFVHNSGSFLKIDKTGNVTFKITGALKMIIDKDMILQAVNYAEVIKGHKDSHIFSSLEEKIGSTSKQTAGGATDIISSAKVGIKGASVSIN